VEIALDPPVVDLPLAEGHGLMGAKVLQGIEAVFVTCNRDVIGPDGDRHCLIVRYLGH